MGDDGGGPDSAAIDGATEDGEDGDGGDGGGDAAIDAGPGGDANDGGPGGDGGDGGQDGNDGGILSGNPYEIELTDVTATVGVYMGGRRQPDPWGQGSGVAVGDVDGDGDLDLVLARCDLINDTPGGPSLLLRNGGGFAALVPDPSFSAGFAGRCAHAPALGDYDGDGDLDLFVGMTGPDVLLRNDGTGQFTDVTTDAGVVGRSEDTSASALWADVNADGWLDLLVTQLITTVPPGSDPQARNRLYLNRGDGSFLDASEASGFGSSIDASSQTALVADLDGDADLEVYVANDRFAIDGTGGFPSLSADAWLDVVGYDGRGVPLYADRSAELGTDGLRSSMGVAIADLDGDGRVEIHVSDWGANHLQAWRPSIGQYQDDAAAWGMDLPLMASGQYKVSWGAAFVDLDRDGGEELIVVNGTVALPFTCMGWTQDDLYLRRAGADSVAPFADITTAVGWPIHELCPPTEVYPIDGRGLAVGDLDGDGDDDLIVSPYAESFRFFRNDTAAPGHRLRIAPRGTVAAPTPAGAVLEVTLPGGTVRRRVLAAGGSISSQSAAILEVGLDAATSVTSALLRWPSGYAQRIDLLPGFQLDDTLAVVEPAWLTVTPRVVPAGETAVLRYRPVDAAGQFLGPDGSGKVVTAIRSDGIAVNVFDLGDGVYQATLTNPGFPRITRMTIVVDGQTLTAAPTVTFH